MSDKPQSTMIVEEVQISRKSKVFKYYIVTTECNFYVTLMSSFMCIFPTINFWLHRYMQALSNKSYSGYNVVKEIIYGCISIIFWCIFYYLTY